MSLRPSPGEGIDIWYLKPSQKPMAEDVLGPSREAAAVILAE